MRDSFEAGAEGDAQQAYESALSYSDNEGLYQGLFSWQNNAKSQVDLPTLVIGQQAVEGGKVSYPSDSKLVDIYRDSRDSVVNIVGTRDKVDAEGNKREVTITGSGFFVTPDGKLATDYHVVNGLRDIKVHTGDGKVLNAKIENVDPGHDLAIVSVTPESPYQTFKVLPLGKSEDLGNGAPIVALGHPLGWSDMYLSPGKFRATRLLNDILPSINGGLMPGEDKYRLIMQTEIHAEHGNSGGPILDAKGKVVGVLGLSDANDQRVGTTAMATPVEDLLALLNKTQKIGRVPTAGSVNLGDKPPAFGGSNFPGSFPGVSDSSAPGGATDKSFDFVLPKNETGITPGDQSFKVDAPMLSHTLVHGVNVGSKLYGLGAGRIGAAGSLLSIASGGYDLLTQDANAFAKSIDRGSTSDILSSGVQVAADALLIGGGLATFTTRGMVAGALMSVGGSAIKLVTDGFKYSKLFQ